jgi:hypothetical protein
MPNKIGATIALDGEKEFKAAIRDADSQMKLLKSELKLTGEQFAKNTGSLKSYQAQNEVLTKQVQAQQGKVDALKQALDHAKEAYGENSTQARHWQTQLNNAQADLVKMNRELDDVKSHAKGVGALKTEFEQAKEKINAAKDKIESARQHLEKLHSVADGVGNVLKAGFSAGLSAGTAALTAIGTAAVAAGKKVWDAANEMSEMGDEVDKGSQKLRVSAEDYQRMKYAAELSGTSIDTLATAQKKLAASGSELDLRQAIDQVAAIEDADKRAAAATELFGAKAGQELLPLLNSGKDGIQAMYDEAEAYGMVMSGDAVKASAKFQDSLSKMKGTMTGLKNEMVGRLLPGLTGLTDGFAEILNGNPDAGIEMISGAVRDLLAQVEELAPTVLQLGGELLQALAEAVLENAPVLVETGTPIIIELIGGILDNLDLLLDAALQLIEYLLNAIDNNSEQLATMAVTLIRKLTLGLLKMLPQLVSVGVDLIVSLVEGLSDPAMAEEIIHAAVECAEALIGGLADKAQDILDAGKHLVEGIWKGISDSYEWIKTKIKGWVGNVLTFLKNLFGIKSPSTVMRDVIGKNLMLGLGEGIDEYAKIPQDAMEKMSASLVAGSDFTYSVNGVYDQIGAAGPQSMTMTSATGAAGTGAPSLETVIALLQVIASQGGRPIVLSDGTLLGWMDSALGQASSRSERGVAN